MSCRENSVYKISEIRVSENMLTECCLCSHCVLAKHKLQILMPYVLD